jgi:uncharacterized protein YebE (UPF0316 family)
MSPSVPFFYFFMFSSLLRFLPVLLFCIPLSTVLGVAAGMKKMVAAAVGFGGGWS